jgi:hypothetical protein
VTVGGDGMANIVIANDESDGVLAIHVNVSILIHPLGNEVLNFSLYF